MIEKTNMVNCAVSLNKEYQMLPTEVFTANFHDFAACESFWQPIDPRKVHALLKNLFYATEECQRTIFSNYIELIDEQTEDDSDDAPTYTIVDATQALLDNGKVISTPIYLIRQVSNKPKCPKCGCSIMEESPALSRVDNKTEICSTCGMKEAFENFFHEA